MNDIQLLIRTTQTQVPTYLPIVQCGQLAGSVEAQATETATSRLEAAFLFVSVSNVSCFATPCIVCLLYYVVCARPRRPSRYPHMDPYIPRLACCRLARAIDGRWGYILFSPSRSECLLFFLLETSILSWANPQALQCLSIRIGGAAKHTQPSRTCSRSCVCHSFASPVPIWLMPLPETPRQISHRPARKERLRWSLCYFIRPWLVCQFYSLALVLACSCSEPSYPADSSHCLRWLLAGSSAPCFMSPTHLVPSIQSWGHRVLVTSAPSGSECASASRRAMQQTS